MTRFRLGDEFKSKQTLLEKDQWGESEKTIAHVRSECIRKSRKRFTS